jgi:hypothetical protein
MESWCLELIKRVLVVLLHAHRGPFYSPKEARSRWKQSRKTNLAFCRVAHRTVRCTTGHCPMRIAFLIWRSLADVENLEPLAHRTVRCPPPTVGSATRHARIAQPTVGAPDHWLTGQSGASPDSPVNYSRTLLTWFPRAATSPQKTHRTVWCTTRQSGDL